MPGAWARWPGPSGGLGRVEAPLNTWDQVVDAFLKQLDLMFATRALPGPASASHDDHIICNWYAPMMTTMMISVHLTSPRGTGMSGSGSTLFTSVLSMCPETFLGTATVTRSMLLCPMFRASDHAGSSSQTSPPPVKAPAKPTASRRFLAPERCVLSSDEPS